MKFRPSNFSKAELDHNTSSDPFQNVLPNEKTSFKETYDYNTQPETAPKAEFAYGKTGK